MTLLSHPLGSATAAAVLPRWTLVSAVLAPLSLIACWIAAGLVQAGGYDAVQQTISVLASDAASHRWIMTAGFYLLATCQLVTAVGFSIGRPVARLVLTLGGCAGLGVAIFPQGSHGALAITHLVFAALSVSLLALWPATIGVRGPSRPLPLTVRGSVVATVVFLCLLAWLYAAAHGVGGLGIAERVDTAIENSWPLVVVVAIRRQGRRA